MKRWIHERECISGLRQQKWTNAYIRKQAASLNPTASHSPVRTNSESDHSAPAASALTRPPNGLLKGWPAEQRLFYRAVPPPEAPERAERDETSPFRCDRRCRLLHNQNLHTDTPTIPPRQVSSYPARHPRPDSPLPASHMPWLSNFWRGTGRTATPPLRLPPLVHQCDSLRLIPFTCHRVYNSW